MLKPEDVVNNTISISVNKSNSSSIYLFYKAILAGIFVVLGICVRNAAVYSIENDSISRVLGGLFFPIGFIFIVFLGGELFTGNTLMIMAVFDKKISFKRMVRNLAVVYFGNFTGTIIGGYLIEGSGFLKIGKGHMGAFIINSAYNKLKLSNGELLFSSILCNIFVCGAILMVTATKDSVAKFLISWFTICTFGIVGFEHIVVNMYYLPSALLSIGEYKGMAADIYGSVLNNLNIINGFNIIRSFAIVTIGNLIGGIVFVSGLLFYIRKVSLVGNHNA